MKCPRCDEYMEKKGENWICSSCGYSWSEHSLFPLVIVVIAVLVYLALQEGLMNDEDEKDFDFIMKIFYAAVFTLAVIMMVIGHYF